MASEVLIAKEPSQVVADATIDSMGGPSQTDLKNTRSEGLEENLAMIKSDQASPRDQLEAGEQFE